MLMFIFGAWNLCTLKNIKQPRSGPPQQLVSVPTQAFHSDCWLPLLQAAITSTCHGVDLCRWLEGRKKKTQHRCFAVSRRSQERRKLPQRSMKNKAWSNMIQRSKDVQRYLYSWTLESFLAECTSTELSAYDTRPHCNGARCCSFFVFNQEFYGFKNVTETAIIVWSCALKQ